MKLFLRTVSFLSLLFFLGGCTSTKVASIVTDPMNATIAIDGKEVGTSPIEHRFEFSDQKGIFDVEARLPGHFPGTAKVSLLPADKTQYSIKLEKLSKTVKIDSVPSPCSAWSAMGLSNSHLRARGIRTEPPTSAELPTPSLVRHSATRPRHCWISAYSLC